MKLGIVINTNEPETVWGAFRIGVTALKAKHTVRIFLYGKGVEAENIKSKFNIKEQLNQFLENKGEILACETCLKIRKKEETKACKIGHQKDLLDLVEESDKVLTFG